MNNSSIDSSVLAEITNGDEAAVRSILLLFRRYNDVDAAQLKEALATDNQPVVALTSHRIKGSSGAIGAVALSAVCSRIEHASRASDLAGVAANVDEFNRELDRLNAHLETICQ
jgi:HPt (histidine-containing phosphotransfer) domain-containing protein